MYALFKTISNSEEVPEATGLSASLSTRALIAMAVAAAAVIMGALLLTWVIWPRGGEDVDEDLDRERDEEQA